jgi:hypothetical protein
MEVRMLRWLSLVNWGRLWIYVAVVALAVYSIGAGVYSGCSKDNAWSLWNLLLIVAATPIALAVHEAGHLIMAIAVGFRVEQIALGFGRIVWRRRIGTVELQLKSLPISGASVSCAPPNERACTAPRMTLYLMGGIITTIALAAVLYITAGDGLRSLLGYTSCRQSFVGMLFLVAVYSIPANLIPTRTWRTVLAYNDGARVIQALAKPRTAASWLLSVPYMKSATDALREEKTDTADLILSSGIEAVPNSFWLRYLRASLRSRIRGVGAARDELESVLASYAESNLERAYCWNDIAYFDVLLNDPKLLSEADEYSRRAVRVAKVPSFVGTRGCVLLRKALAENPRPRPMDADVLRVIRMLRKVYWSLGAEKAEKAADAAWLAIAEAHLGMDVEVQRWLRRSRGMATVPEYAIAEAEIAELEERPENAPDLNSLGE